FLDLPEVIAMLASRRIRRSEIGGTCQIAGGFVLMHRRKSYDMTKMTFIICNGPMNIKNKQRNLPASARSALLAANGLGMRLAKASHPKPRLSLELWGQLSLANRLESRTDTLR